MARDFIFMDESGEPGVVTPYYIQGLIHVTDESLKNLNVHLGAFRYFGSIKRELTSTRLNALQREQLLNILKLAVSGKSFVKASAVYVRKERYVGPYLQEKHNYPKNPSRFRHLIIRKLLEFHFMHTEPQSQEIELVVDRFERNEAKEQRMKNYLRAKRSNSLPSINSIIQADSRYVEMLQAADWISGSVKERLFTHPERDFGDLFQYIKVKEITG